MDEVPGDGGSRTANRRHLDDSEVGAEESRRSVDGGAGAAPDAQGQVGRSDVVFRRGLQMWSSEVVFRCDLQM